MAEIEDGTGGEEMAAAKAGWAPIKKIFSKIPSLRPNLNNNYHTHPIFENMRSQGIGNVFLSMTMPIFALTVYIFFNSSNPDKKLFGLVLPVLFAGGVAIIHGLVLRDTFPRLACVLEQVGIFLVCLSLTLLVAFLVSGPALAIPAFCLLCLVMVPFVIPTLHRDPDPLINH